MRAEEVIAKFKEIDFTSVESAKRDVINVIQSITHLPSYIHRFEGGQVLSRIRPNENENGESFKTFKDLSYKPEQFNHSYQRASGPGFTMFYGGYSDTIYTIG